MTGRISTLAGGRWDLKEAYSPKKSDKDRVRIETFKPLSTRHKEVGHREYCVLPGSV
jgi:hypothetical protein